MTAATEAIGSKERAEVVTAARMMFPTKWSTSADLKAVAKLFVAAQFWPARVANANTVENEASNEAAVKD